MRELQPLRGLPLVSLNLAYCNQLTDLTPLQGMPLTSLDLFQCSKLHDLSPLKGMPLTSLHLFGCPELHDLTPLAGMSLSEIELTPQNFTAESLEVLRPCESLKTIVVGNKPTDRLAPEEFWKKFAAGDFKP